mgnify:FL=1
MTTTRPSGWITITQTARLLGKTYQTTRDVLLAGKCGPTRLDGRTLLALEKNVLAYRDAATRATAW